MLLTAGGKVRDDNDFVFSNQPEHSCGAVGRVGWTKVVELRHEYSTVVVMGTGEHGGAHEEVADSEYATSARVLPYTPSILQLWCHT